MSPASACHRVSSEGQPHGQHWPTLAKQILAKGFSMILMVVEFFVALCFGT